MKKMLTLFILVFGMSSFGWAQSGANTVADIIAGSSDHTTLNAALQASGLDATLSGPGPFTVFAPTDDAFAALPPGALDALLENPEELLTHILLYHAVGAEAQSGDLSDGQMITTLNGQDVTVDLDGGVFINAAEVTVPDLIADNGVVHVIDAVLVPQITTVWSIIEGSPDHNTLEAGILAAGLEGALDGFATNTVFAPTDAAFDALPAGVLDGLLADPSGLLTDILLYHVVGAEALSGDLADGQMITTLNGQDVTVTIDGGVFINGAEVIVADLDADNGVVHVIDAVLLPEFDTVWEIIEGSDDHNTLEAGVMAAGLDGTLDDPFATFTIFAPTDAAFDALPAGVLDGLLADPSGLLTDILLYHVVGAEALSGDLSDGQMITTLNGQDVTVTIDGGVFINGAEVTVADLTADNGIVHVIDAVLLPEFDTVWEIIEGSDDHNTLEAGVMAAGLDGTLNDPFGTFTVFAPTDDAFEALPDGLLDALLADPSGLLTDILLYHVVGAEALSGDLSDGQMITTLNGQDVTVTIDGGVFINGAEVTVADLTADNGVVHVIDAVLLPEFNSVWNIIENSDDHMTLEAAILAAGLDAPLNDLFGTFTVFAPTDDAFEALPDGTVDALLADPNGLLTDILLYHVAGIEALSGDLSDGQMVTTLNGQDVTVTIDGGVFINDAEVIIADLQADNGVVHVIDAVLIPGVCTDFAGGPYNDFNTVFGGAPVSEDGPCPVNQITAFEVWASESYIVEGFQEGVTYTFSICEGPGAGSWNPVLSILDSEGNVVTTAYGCEISWTAEYDGEYIIGINEVGACGTSENQQTNNGYPTLTCDGPAPFTVWDIIVNSDDHTLLETAVVAAGLDGALDNAEGSLTVFAPTDAAFNALPAGVLDALLADPDGLLTDYLTYHVVGAVALSSSLSDGQMITTLNGADVTVSLDGGVFINDAEVIVPDLEADNGVVHVIDMVLDPTTVGINEIDRANVDLFPNPSTGLVNINLTNININTAYQVINTTGAIVDNGTLVPGMNTIDLEGLNTGLYLINVFTENGSKTQRLVIR